MAKRSDLTTSGPDQGNADSAAQSKEQRLVAFAEQLGWIVGTVQGKAEGWLNSEALTTQISKVRDSASALLEQIRPTPTKISSKGKVAAKVRASGTSGAANTKSGSKGRSGGVVDAPGKKHRKPVPSETGATGSPRGQGSRISKLTSHKQNRVQRRG
jgi:hypothetical protein